MNVLAIGCHPDDVEICCAGTLAKCVKRGDKVIAFKKRRRKNSRRKRGYRDELTVIRITEILTGGKAPSVGPRPKKEKAPVEAKAADGDAPAKKAPAKKASDETKAKAPAKKAAAKKPTKEQEA